MKAGGGDVELHHDLILDREEQELRDADAIVRHLEGDLPRQPQAAFSGADANGEPDFSRNAVQGK